MSTGITKKYMMNVISKLPMPFLYQFFKLSCYYNGFINMKNPVEQQRTRSWYISVSANVQTMINTLMSLSTNGKPIEDQIKLMQEKIEHTIKEANKFYLENQPEQEGPLDALILQSDGSVPKQKEESEEASKKAAKKSTTKKTMMTKKRSVKTSSKS